MGADRGYDVAEFIQAVQDMGTVAHKHGEGRSRMNASKRQPFEFEAFIED